MLTILKDKKFKKKMFHTIIVNIAVLENELSSLAEYDYSHWREEKEIELSVYYNLLMKFYRTNEQGKIIKSKL